MFGPARTGARRAGDPMRQRSRRAVLSLRRAVRIGPVRPRVTPATERATRGVMMRARKVAGTSWVFALCFLLTAAARPAQTKPLFPGLYFGVGSSPTSLAAGDLNGDGFVDAVVTAYPNYPYQPNVYVLFGRADGTFAPPVAVESTSGVSAVIVADVDGDGHDDIVGLYGFSILILLGRGDGAFAPQPPIAITFSPSSVVVADLNADGVMDLAAAGDWYHTPGYSAGRGAVLLGFGDKTFSAPGLVETSDGPSALVAADFNQDGRLDLATANRRTNDVSVLRGLGDGTFATQMRFSVGDYPAALGADDFNQDGRMDLAVTNSGSTPQGGSVSLLFGRGDGTFEPEHRLPADGSPAAILVADLNGDHLQDLAVADVQSNALSLWFNSGGGGGLTEGGFPPGPKPNPDGKRNH